MKRRGVESPHIRPRTASCTTTITIAVTVGWAGRHRSDVSLGQMADLYAYLLQLIEDVSEWPVQGSTLVQVMLYTLLPVVSWFGSLLIEGALGLVF